MSDDFLKNIKSIDTSISFDQLEDELNKQDYLTLCSPILLPFLNSEIVKLKKNKVLGDFVEVGVWKGGIGLALKHLSNSYEFGNNIYLYDTFEGFSSKPKDHHKKDQTKFASFQEYKVTVPTLENVKSLFTKHKLFDDSIKLIKCDIRNLAPNNTPYNIALLHIDVDFAEPTYSALTKLYHKVSKGGIIIIDDYGVEQFNCKEAVDNFRKENGIRQDIHFINEHMVYWIK